MNFAAFISKNNLEMHYCVYENESNLIYYKYKKWFFNETKINVHVFIVKILCILYDFLE